MFRVLLFRVPSALLLRVAMFRVSPLRVAMFRAPLLAPLRQVPPQRAATLPTSRRPCSRPLPAARRRW
jgi:hypothetical protein